MELTYVQWLLGLMMIVLTIRIAWVDIHELRIPNTLNYIHAGLGVLNQFLFGVSHLAAALCGALATMLLLNLIRALHKRLRGRIGLGLGDVKLAGASALWLGPIGIPMYLFIASATALTFAITAALFCRFDLRNTRIPFAPFLGLSLILVWMTDTILLTTIGD
ncbi:prepilin peptidase [Agrobacterium pusense]|uniref:prepilin peptidase n=1 Tax=Agrobacterium pusense TaxID=648995 RepID=UPI00115496C4